MEAVGNTIVFERDQGLKQQVFKLFWTNLSSESQAAGLIELMCWLPHIAAPAELDGFHAHRRMVIAPVL